MERRDTIKFHVTSRKFEITSNSYPWQTQKIGYSPEQYRHSMKGGM